jgi:hypothetical protein
MTERLKTNALIHALLWAFTASIWVNGIDLAEFRSRRKAYAERTTDGVTVLFNALEEDLREFAVDKNFYYLTGAAIPDAILVLSPAHSQHKETLFIPERDLAQEKWTETRSRCRDCKHSGTTGSSLEHSSDHGADGRPKEALRCCRTAGTAPTPEGT